MLASLDGIVVLQVMVECRVLPLKRRVHLLCDYVRAEDPTREAVEELEENAIVEHLSKLDGARVVVLTRCTIEAFLVSHRPDLVSRPSFHFSFFDLSSH